jgi:rhodanese-related sulfurtransferase
MTTSPTGATPTVGPTEAKERADAGALLIDVREQLEWDQARIPGAELKPLSQASSWYQDLPRDGEIIFYCRSGARSGQIVRALIDQAGFSNVVNMRGGIIEWAKEGLPVEGAQQG